MRYFACGKSKTYEISITLYKRYLGSPKSDVAFTASAKCVGRLFLRFRFVTMPPLDGELVRTGIRVLRTME